MHIGHRLRWPGGALATHPRTRESLTYRHREYLRASSSLAPAHQHHAGRKPCQSRERERTNPRTHIAPRQVVALVYLRKTPKVCRRIAGNNKIMIVNPGAHFSRLQIQDLMISVITYCLGFAGVHQGDFLKMFVALPSVFGPMRLFYGRTGLTGQMLSRL